MDFILRNLNNLDFFTFIILGCISLLCIIKLSYQQQFNEFITFLSNGKYLILHNKKELKSNFFNSLFFLFFSTNSSLFCFFLANKFDFIDSNSFISLGYFFLSINIFFIVKYVIEKLLFEILDLNHFYKSIHFQKLTLINYISLILFLVNLTFFYIHTTPSTFFIFCIIATLLLLYLLTIVFLTFYNQKIILRNWFYFILYLCAFEIAPILLAVIWLKTNP
ncbi:DUF4271 domain-containing protein [Pseudofulvibacter geojedonensis]|uniref:DUF4271 domain-containing protein n=1 Tax=Pseudofulvibacter geojedonensis TaxID=1123758 RepID=A0ABW3I1P9_9FLAO